MMFASSIPYVADDKVYQQWLSHGWPVLIPLVLVFCAMLVALVVVNRRRAHDAAPDSGPVVRQCDYCGRENEAAAEICWECGTKLKPSEVAYAPAPGPSVSEGPVG